MGLCYDSSREVKYFVYYFYIEILDNDVLLDSSSKLRAQGCHVGSLVSAMRLYLHDRNWKMLQIRAFLLREPVVKHLLETIANGNYLG